MTDSKVFDRVTKVIAEVLDVPRSALSAATLVKQDLGADSMQLVTLMIALDDEFDAEFDVDQIPASDVSIEWVCRFVETACASTEK